MKLDKPDKNEKEHIEAEKIIPKKLKKSAKWAN